MSNQRPEDHEAVNDMFQSAEPDTCLGPTIQIAADLANESGSSRFLCQIVDEIGSALEERGGALESTV
eukprot:9046999-Pyramimonas_sp.AAC.1